MFSGIPVDGAAGQQDVFIHIKHQDSHYVLLHDRNMGSLYIEVLKNPFRVDLYASDNFEKIEDDEEWTTIYNVLDDSELMKHD